MTLETLDASGGSLGTWTYPFTITAPASVVPTLSSVSAAPINSHATINSWGLYVYGKSQARLTINGAVGAYGSTIKSYSIETSPSIGSASASTLTTGILYKTGTITVTAKITDSRGRTATATTSLYIYYYGSPYFTENIAYRCNSSGTRDDAGGTYAYVKSYFSCYSLNGNNSVTGSVVVKQVGGSNIASRSVVSGTGYVLGNGNLVSDATYQTVVTITDSLGSVTTYTGEINSAAYIMHIKKGGKAVGFGMAAGDDETVSFGWPIKLTAPLEVSQGGTGASTAANACAALGAVKKSGDTMTGNLSISANLYPSVYLLPYYNFTTNRTVFEGSYVGASSFAAWEDSTGNNRRMLEVRTKQYVDSIDNAVVLRGCENGTWYSHRLFHAGMATPVPVANGGTGGATAKAALTNLGIFFAASLPASGTDGQICLVPIS